MLSWPVSSALLLPCNLAQRLRNTWVACYDNGNGLTRLLQIHDRGKGRHGRRCYYRYQIFK